MGLPKLSSPTIPSVSRAAWCVQHRIFASEDAIFMLLKRLVIQKLVHASVRKSVSLGTHQHWRTSAVCHGDVQDHEYSPGSNFGCIFMTKYHRLLDNHLYCQIRDPSLEPLDALPESFQAKVPAADVFICQIPIMIIAPFSDCFDWLRPFLH